MSVSPVLLEKQLILRKFRAEWCCYKDDNICLYRNNASLDQFIITIICYFKPLVIYLQILPFLFSQLEIFRLVLAASKYMLKKNIYQQESQKREGNLYSEGLQRNHFC